MDEIVKQAMAKWPNVPACHGWLGLDARGNWYLRDQQTQDAGEFAGGFAGGVAQSKGSRVEHAKLIEFIARNYLADADGCWYFQNGPQRVFVELENTPLIWRVRRSDTDGLHIHSHTGTPVAASEIQSSVVDESGCLYLLAPQGLGLVHSQDVLDAAAALDAGDFPEPVEIESALLPERFGFVRSPQNMAALLKQRT